MCRWRGCGSSRRSSSYLKASKPDILAGISNLGTLSEPEVLSEAILAFKKIF